MEQLHDHKINPFNDEYVTVEVLDKPDAKAGGACHVYQITVADPDGDDDFVDEVELSFQHGPVGEAGVNGLTDQALLAIVLHRWRAFQRSKWSNRETAISITKLEEALMWQHKRTLDRIERNVEGTNEV